MTISTFSYINSGALSQIFHYKINDWLRVIAYNCKVLCKVNIFTDLDKAGKAGIEEGLAAGASSMMALIPYEIEAMKRVVRNKLELFGSVGRA